MSRAEALTQFIDKLIEASKRHYGSRLVGIIQFGSTVRQVKPNTDLDLLVVLDEPARARHERYDEWDLIERDLQPALRALAGGGTHLALSPLIKTGNEIDRFQGYYLDFVDQSNILFDPEGILATLVKRIDEFIKTSGAIKKRVGLLWYWDLAPDATWKDERKVGW